MIASSVPASTPVAASVLQLRGVVKHYGTLGAAAVAGVELTLGAGEILGLLGPSGCGKTTLLRLIGGFERPDGGEISLGGVPVATAYQWVPPEQRFIGMVFQDFALFPHLTVAQNVAFGLRSRPGVGSQEIRDRLQTVLKLVALTRFEQRYPHELSGGQQQRVALARALAPQPQVILLDEPLSNLDVQVRLYLRQEIRRILKDAGTSAVFVTHDQEEALSVADRVAVMRQGCLEQVDSPEGVYRHPATRFVAEFVTQANFLPARREGSQWVTEVGAFPMAGSGAETAIAGTLMMRQEDLQLTLDDSGPVVIRDRQFLGREYAYCLQTPSGATLQARTATHGAFPVGGRVRITADADALRFFAE